MIAESLNEQKMFAICAHKTIPVVFESAEGSTSRSKTFIRNEGNSSISKTTGKITYKGMKYATYNQEGQSPVKIQQILNYPDSFTKSKNSNLNINQSRM